ncbi:AT-hook motif nuclear-localized protein 23-like [Daucus carota subsp. sativus]|uniref:AT-hook motif nuclear-localized protein 23-like n=1 Tax=Daucus carota subsp. sativus TaxID=79200 RepID=UPI0007EFA4CD|nr:PREDICTED: AT-hook motif nuclear-localized protein 23-like [Daucus carota subsp. sativus]
MSNSKNLGGSSSQAPGRHGGAPHYSFNSHMSLTTNDVSMNAINKHSVMETVFLKIPNGFDVISCVVQFAQHFGVSVTVLTGQGLISDVVVYPRGVIRPPYVSTMISFSGTYSCLNAASRDIISCFHVQFADAAGNVIGGRIHSQMKAASIITLVLAVSTQV